ncbi:phosphatidic acid phosphatase type 2/haloperoxidase [Sphaerosporella brunnea]|uniref:Phosphatidic acid phosphatase type 2/haloperoxidase n=1 Tax=Sphaerosporella brunnea TaxID=1250544 RepID=A0A5J5FCW5_9PEZI|nr:phosphatidic acid phosphatase type 2/haloperoxidase [Sphaerosporella brunnea]
MAGLLQDRGWRQRWVLSYIFDYVIIIILIGGFSALDLAEPYNQPFSLDNDSLKYPYANPERISAKWCGVIACLFPLIFIIFWIMLVDGMFSHHKPPSNRSRIMSGPWQMNDRLWEINCGILGLGLSVAGAICVTGALKNSTGKPRPDIIARCIPRAGSRNPEWGLVTSEICTQTTHAILKDGFKSWPSGHASTAFAGLGYLSLFLAGKLHIMDNRGEVWKAFIVLVPLLAAALVSVSRIMDARHHPFDVLSGAVLGEFMAWVAYRQYFPPLTDPKKKGRAYPRRTWALDTQEVADQGPVEYSAALRMEEGRSTESLDSESRTGSRKRSPGHPGPVRASTYTDSSAMGTQSEFEMVAHVRQGTDPLPHRDPLPQRAPWGDGRASVDMGETRQQEEQQFGHGRLSPSNAGMHREG